MKRRRAAASDPVATGVVSARCSLLYRSITAAAAAAAATAATDSRRRRLVLLSARELFRGVGFLGERAARDAIVLPVPVPTADCVPAHDRLACRRRGPPGRAPSVVARSATRRCDFRANPIAGFYRSIAVHLFRVLMLRRSWIRAISSCFSRRRWIAEASMSLAPIKLVQGTSLPQKMSRRSEVFVEYRITLVNVRLGYPLELSKCPSRVTFAVTR